MTNNDSADTVKDMESQGISAKNTEPQQIKHEPQSAMQTSIEDLLRANSQQQRTVEAAVSVAAEQQPPVHKSPLPAPKPVDKPKSDASSQSYSLPHQIPQQANQPQNQGQQGQAQRVQATRPQQNRSYIERAAGIKVVGVGGAGCNAIERMMEEGMTGVEFIAINTDQQALSLNHATTKIVIGEKVTKGRGAGSDPEVGRRAMEQSAEEIKMRIAGADLVFIAAGMGGGTGTGAAPLVADIAKKAGALTVAVVTKPFPFEGSHRMRIAREGIMELSSRVDTLITVPNEKLMSIANKDLSLLGAFRKVDDILRSGVRGITDIILQTGIINVDFADIQSVLLNGGSSQVGIGSAAGPDRAVMAAQNAIFSPLLETSIDGAKAILFNVTGDSTMSLYEVKAAADIIVNAADSEARIVFGSVVDERLTNGEVVITVIATGLTTDTEREAMALEARHQETADILSRSHTTVESYSSDDDMDMPAILRRNKMKALSS